VNILRGLLGGLLLKTKDILNLGCENLKRRTINFVADNFSLSLPLKTVVVATLKTRCSTLRKGEVNKMNPFCFEQCSLSTQFFRSFK
jgi:hypothetical protein